MKNYFLLIIVIISLLILSGCGNKNNKQTIGYDIAGKTKAKVDIRGNNIKLESGSAKFQGGDKTTLPTNFPNDVYVIDGELQGVYQDTSVNGFVLTVKTDKTIEEIKKIYQEKLATNNWKILSDFSQTDVLNISAQKDDRNLTISAGKDGNQEMTVTIIIGKKMF